MDSSHPVVVLDLGPGGLTFGILGSCSSVWFSVCLLFRDLFLFIHWCS